MAVSVMAATLYVATLAPAAAGDAGEPEVPPDSVIVECFPQRLSIGMRLTQKQGTRATVRVLLRMSKSEGGPVGTLTLRVMGPGGKQVKRAVTTVDGSATMHTFRTKRLHKRGVYRVLVRFAGADDGGNMASSRSFRVR